MTKAEFLEKLDLCVQRASGNARVALASAKAEGIAPDSPGIHDQVWIALQMLVQVGPSGNLTLPMLAQIEEAWEYYQEHAGVPA